VALANLEIIERENLISRAAAVGARMLERLKPLEELDAVGEVRGVGLMLGIELAGERDAGPVAAAALERGVVVRASGQKVVMSPPFVIEDAQAGLIVDVLSEELARLP
jgi:putrescine aminotransferase